MHIILSQKRDTESKYMDELFSVYHYPPRYRNQIHTGDVFIYYQGDRYHKENRYYFGTGKIGNIYQVNNDDYYAELYDCYKFSSIVPIYKDDGYIEQIGYQAIRKSPTPPWQSSIRPLSEEAAGYIIKQAGYLNPVVSRNTQVDLENELREAVREYYREGNKKALKTVISSATRLDNLLGEPSSNGEN